jgi:hypothetical protein
MSTTATKPTLLTAPPVHGLSTTFTMAGTPFRTAYFWLRTITPATTLNEQHNKK